MRYEAILNSGTSVPITEDEFEKLHLGIMRNIGRNLTLTTGGIMRTMDISYIGPVLNTNAGSEASEDLGLAESLSKQLKTANDAIKASDKTIDKLVREIDRTRIDVVAKIPGKKTTKK